MTGQEIAIASIFVLRFYVLYHSRTASQGKKTAEEEKLKKQNIPVSG